MRLKLFGQGTARKFTMLLSWMRRRRGWAGWRGGCSAEGAGIKQTHERGTLLYALGLQQVLCFVVQASDTGNWMLRFDEEDK